MHGPSAAWSNGLTSPRPPNVDVSPMRSAVLVPAVLSLAACAGESPDRVTAPPTPPPTVEQTAKDTMPPTGYVQHLLDAEGAHGSVVALDSAGDAFGDLSTSPVEAVEWAAPSYHLAALKPLARDKATRLIAVTLDGTPKGQAVGGDGNGYTVEWNAKSHQPTILGTSLGVSAVCPCDGLTWVYQEQMFDHGSVVTVPPPAAFTSFNFVGAAIGGEFVAEVDAEAPSGIGPTVYPYRFSLAHGWQQLDAPDTTLITSESPNGTTVGRRDDGTGYIWPGTSVESLPALTDDRFPTVFPNAVNDSSNFAAVAFNGSSDSALVVFIARTDTLIGLPNATDGDVTAINAKQIVGAVTVDSLPVLWTPTH